MSRHVRGHPPNQYAATSATFTFVPPEPTIHKLVDVTCDDCGAKGITFDNRTPIGWEHRQRHDWAWPLWCDLCPECSAKPEPPIDTDTAFA